LYLDQACNNLSQPKLIDISLIMGNVSSHRDEIPLGEEPEFKQLAPSVCVLSFQGYRLNMEDGYDFQIYDTLGLQALVVFDGHSGKGSMEFGKKHLLPHLAFAASVEECSNANIDQAFISTERALREYNKALDLKALQEHAADCLGSSTSVSASGGSSAPPPLRINTHHHTIDKSGTCAIAAIIKNEELIIANAGDCTALLIFKDGTHKVLNPIHRPVSVRIPGLARDDCAETVRIIEAGLCVQQNRVNGELAVSRSIGDFGYKGLYEEEAKHAVTCIPSITRCPIDDTFKCLYLYTDGIGDGMDPAQIAEYDMASSFHGNSRDTLETLLRECMVKTRDNATIARIDF
jgi:serine/threonine protein phosphatase PrpC